MQDTKQTKKQLIQGLVALRQRLAACEAFNRPHQQTADMLPESETHFAGDLGSCRDITERKQREEALPRVVVHLHNVVEAGNGSVRVTIRTQVVTEQPKVVIHDTGYGIAPEYLPHIFDPFSTTQDLDGGTGLGLSLTYEIITEHGGTVDIATQVGHGTTVTLRLPVAPVARGAPVHSVR